MTGGPPCGGAAFTGIVAPSMMAAFFGHLVLALWLDLRKGSPGCESLTVVNLVRLFVARAN